MKIRNGFVSNSSSSSFIISSNKNEEIKINMKFKNINEFRKFVEENFYDSRSNVVKTKKQLEDCMGFDEEDELDDCTNELKENDVIYFSVEQSNEDMFRALIENSNIKILMAN